MEKIETEIRISHDIEVLFENVSCRLETDKSQIETPEDLAIKEHFKIVCGLDKMNPDYLTWQDWIKLVVILKETEIYDF